MSNMMRVLDFRYQISEFSFECVFRVYGVCVWVNRLFFYSRLSNLCKLTFAVSAMTRLPLLKSSARFADNRTKYLSVSDHKWELMLASHWTRIGSVECILRGWRPAQQVHSRFAHTSNCRSSACKFTADAFHLFAKCFFPLANVGRGIIVTWSAIYFVGNPK